jgi:hypothetical protein
MKPQGSSILLALIFSVVAALFASWLIFEIILLVLVLSFAGRGIVWPKNEFPENPLWFGLFWGLTVGILGYPIWQELGLIQVIPKLLGQL